MEAIRITLYVLTILTATVTWCLAAAFLSLTTSHLDTFWRGDAALLVFGILAMLFLPFLAWLGSRRRGGSLTGPAIAESVTVFIFWAIFLAATAKFSSSYHTTTGWRNRCRVGFSLCSTGRALLSFGWITFGLLTALFIVVVVRGVFAEKEQKHEERQGGNIVVGQTATGNQVEPHPPFQATTATGKRQESGVGAGGTGMTQVPQAQV